MSNRIEVYCDSQGVSYQSSKLRLINAGLASEFMFPHATEAWRGNGMFRAPEELLWSVQRLDNGKYRVMWGLALQAESSNEDP